jgi:hypothetical protein
MTITDIAEELNNLADGRPIGTLQSLRKQRLGRRTATHKLFADKSIFEDNGYAYHIGGRSELQYNIGFEEKGFRYGVAFSMEPSFSFPNIDALLPNVARFNEFFRVYPDEFSDLLMWHSTDGKRSPNYSPGPIPAELVESTVFIFLGELLPADQIDYDRVLDIFDRLLPLYAFVQGNSEFPEVLPADKKFEFTPGCSLKQSTASASLSERTLNIRLRHNDLQVALHRYLSSQYGKEAVGTELGNGAGARVDIVVKQKTAYWFYEIKTAVSARGCIREALSQLVEYSLWPGAQYAERLIIVGEASVDADSRTYLERLNKDFNLPIEYQQFDMKAGKVVC